MLRIHYFLMKRKKLLGRPNITVGESLNFLNLKNLPVDLWRQKFVAILRADHVVPGHVPRPGNIDGVDESRFKRIPVW